MASGLVDTIPDVLRPDIVPPRRYCILAVFLRPSKHAKRGLSRIMRFFLAGIMQGSNTEAILHDQDYRQHAKGLLIKHIPEADVYDPLTDNSESLGYDDRTGRRVFFAHNMMCREVDVLLAFLPEASMGTAIEMWEAYQHGAVVVTISPLRVNWAVRFLSHILIEQIDQFESALESGQLVTQIKKARRVIEAGRD